MGQEHISYMKAYKQIHVKFLCDTNHVMLMKAASLISKETEQPELFHSENQLLERIRDIDLLVIATPNYLHTPLLLRWATNDICILVEKPIAINETQVRALRMASPTFKANIWTAMEYRFIPAVNKLIQLLPTIGPIKSVTIRENRFPFLSKVGNYSLRLMNFIMLVTTCAIDTGASCILFTQCDFCFLYLITFPTTGW
jgi:predicted dehydrogenase